MFTPMRMQAQCDPDPRQPYSPSQAPMVVAMDDSSDGIVTAMSSFVRAESMDVSNDPRFFTANVLDKRFAAFGGLSICATLCAGSALNSCFSMPKDWDLCTLDGIMEFTGFALTNLVLFFSIFAAYTSVSQIYLTYRLMTAGPTGFEIASSFYLNPNIAFWRHAAMKQMLLSLPLFLMSGAFQIFVRINQEMPGAVHKPPNHDPGHIFSTKVFGASVLSSITFVIWTFAALVLFYVNYKHLAVFKEQYSHAKDLERPLMSQVAFLSQRSHRPEV